MVGYQSLEDSPVALGLVLVVLAPRCPKLPLTLGIVALDAFLPKLLAKLMLLLGCALVVAPLYEAPEFVLGPLAPAYIHFIQLLPFHCPRTRGQSPIPLAAIGYCYRPRPRPYLGIGTQ